MREEAATVVRFRLNSMNAFIDALIIDDFDSVELTERDAADLKSAYSGGIICP